MKRWRYLVALAAAVGLFAGAGPALDRCDPGTRALAWTERGPRGQGPLEVGAGKAPLSPPLPATVGGYGPPRPTATRALAPLFARAVVLKRGTVRLGLVNADLLLIPEAVSTEVRRRAQALGLTDVMVVATHAHSSFGGYDDRLVPKLAALGRYHPQARQALVEALTAALKAASGKLSPAALQVVTGEVPKLVRSRDAGEPADPRLTRVVFRGPDRALAQLVIFAAHPTTAGRKPKGLEPDYPGRLAAAEEARGAGVTLFLPGAVGNGSAGKGGGPKKFAAAVADALPAVAPPTAGAATGLEASDDALSLDRSRFSLPHPDASRLVPFGLRRLTEDVLCSNAPDAPAVEVLDLGALQLVGVPGEPTFQAAQSLEEAVGPTARVVSVADGYLGYVETAAHVRAGAGEAKRQYFGPGLLDRMVDALKTRDR